jgi:hypothetical protein
MAIPERETLAFEGIVVVAVDLIRPKGSAAAAAVYSAVGGGGVGASAGGGLTCRARITTRGMWTDNGRLMDTLHQVRPDAHHSFSIHSQCIPGGLFPCSCPEHWRHSANSYISQPSLCQPQAPSVRQCLCLSL